MSGDENNNWINSAPVKGDSTGGFPGGSGIEVRPDGLKLFSTQAEGEAKNFTTGFIDGFMPLTQQAGQIGMSFQEAANFAGRHGEAINATSMLGKDATVGLLALGLGAKTIAINYINGDATSAATLPQVLDAFDASKGNGLRDDLERTDQEARAGSGKDKTVRLPEATPVDTDDFHNPTDPGFSKTIELGDNASYTVPGASDCLDIEMAGPETTNPVTEQYRDDLTKENYQPAPYDPDDYR